MIVIDASAMVEALIGRKPESELLDGLAGELAAPHLLDIEVMSVLRGLMLGGRLTADVAERARRFHFALTINRHEAEPFAERIWQLRHQFTSYDAYYLALAEALDATLFTCDRKLAVGGHHARVAVFPRSGMCQPV